MMTHPSAGLPWMADNGPGSVPASGPCAHRAAVLRLARPCDAVHPPHGKGGSGEPGRAAPQAEVVLRDSTAGLTRREREVLALVARGWPDGAIAAHLFISKKTASVHVANIKDKLGTRNRVETALAGLRLDLDPRVT